MNPRSTSKTVSIENMTLRYGRCCKGGGPVSPAVDCDRLISGEHVTVKCIPHVLPKLIASEQKLATDWKGNNSCGMYFRDQYEKT